MKPHFTTTGSDELGAQILYVDEQGEVSVVNADQYREMRIILTQLAHPAHRYIPLEQLEVRARKLLAQIAEFSRRLPGGKSW